ncbi:hypothetical protein CRYO30217_00555 [Parvicella tangerina]|uniref:ComEC family competence protein n=2 Tax=Parvicella tangerina TaxID=2829795 RepID=A0A916JKQ9_9FLAO|nr:hypothetical protein CRYO30217_00555 [Parvicella tangerina]
MIAGILVAIYSELQSIYWVVPMLGAIALLGSYLLYIKYRPALRKEFVFGGITLIAFFFVGINLIIFKTAEYRTTHYQNFTNEYQNNYLVEVSEIPKEKPNSVQVVAKINAVKQENDQWISSTGQVLLYFKKDSASLNILQGDIIYVESDLQDINEPQNPGQFNYKQYLSFNQIYQQGFVQQNDWKLLSSGHFSIISYASVLRDRLLETLKHHGLSDDELAVASALILGYKDDLDNELKHSYSSAGATHVLAVSGLHVGIIFLAISFVLGVFDKNEKLTFTRLFIVLGILWSYATITGLSPSVVRAATMFSFVAVGKAFKRDSNIYNTLAGSALVLLIINPYLIMEVGFQLSYLAVLGIVYFQKIIYRRLYVKNKLLDYVWTITSVSIAAQLTTFPLGLLYFHQFPTYFFISNLVVIPAAMIIIALGIGLFLTSWAPPVASVFGFLLTWVIYGMNWVVKSIDQLPVSLIEGISISILECWMIYAIIVLFVISKESRKLVYLNWGMILFALILTNDHIEDTRHHFTKEIVFYSVKDEPNINFVDGKTNILISSDQLYQDRSTMLFNIKHHWFDLDLNTPQHFLFDEVIQTKQLLGKNNFYQFYDQTIYHFTNTSNPVKVGKVDLLYISAQDYYPVDNILQLAEPELIILSNGCHWQYHKELEKIYPTPKDHYHDIKHQGAYVKSL